MRIIIIGFGSIGQRHHRNLTAMGYKDIYVYDPDPERLKNQKLKVKSLGIKILRGFDVVFVCSPNQLHVKHALAAAKAGCHVFIEKPLSHNQKGIPELARTIRKKKLVNMVACNMRFHPAYAFMKKYLQQKRLGKIYSIALSFGYYLPYWRKTDYRKNFAAKRSTGGGIILDDIHEFDLLFWLNDFKHAEKSVIVSDRVSNLAIETEDLAVGVFKFKNKVIGLVKADYLNQSYTRRCQIVGEKGTLEWDFRKNTVWLSGKSGEKKIFERKNFDFNRVYVDEVRYFFECVKKRQPTFNSISRARALLKTILTS